MPITEKSIRIAARLYETRDTMRNLLSDRYAGALKPYREMLAATAAKLHCDTLHACLVICEKTQGMTAPMFIAAAVEMAEEETGS